MLTELFKLLGIIAIDNKDANKAIDDTTNKGKQSESKLGKAFSGIGKGALAVGKAVGTGMIAAGTAVAGLVTQSTNVFAEFEQLSGGAELMFGSAYQSVMEKAKNAYKTVQMSQNEYLTQVNGFATGLKTALGGNEQAAADLAHRIVKAEADIVAATGRASEDVQNAFNGIMKNNFSMLDNLGLGITATKEGFQEVIDRVNDWNKANGNATKYQISNLADCQSALVDYIEMVGMSGYANDEAAGTISGSMASVKASWQNLMSAMADDKANLGEYISAFTESLVPAFQNMMPRIQTALHGVVDLVKQLAPVLIAEIPGLVGQLLPGIITAATGLVNAVVEELPGLLDMIINEMLPQFLNGVVEIINALVVALPSLIETLVSALPTLIPQIVNSLVQLMITLCTMLPQIIQPIIDNLPTILMSIINALVTNLPMLINTIVQMIPSIILSIVDALMENLPALIDGVVLLVVGIVAALPDIILTLIDALPELFVMIVNGLLGALPTLIEGVGTIVVTVTSAVWELLKAFPEKLGSFVNTLWGNLSNIIFGVWEVIKTGIKTVITTISANISTVWHGIWNTIRNIVNGISTSISGVFNGIKDTVSRVWKKIKSSIIDPITEAKDKVGAVIDIIKGFFSGMKLEFPKLKMPHFGITPKGWKIGDLLKGEIPKLAIDWYAKAMNEPMIMNRPTIFGYNGATGELMGGGEAGSEVVSGTNTLMQMIQGAVAAQNETLVYYLQKLIEMLADYFPEALDAMRTSATLDAEGVAVALAVPMDRQLGILAAQKGRGR